MAAYISPRLGSPARLSSPAKKIKSKDKSDAQLRAAAHDDDAPAAHDSASAAHDSASAGPVGLPLVGRVLAGSLGLPRDETASGLAPSRAPMVALRVTLAHARRGARYGAIEAEAEDDDRVGMDLASFSEASAVSSAEDNELEIELEIEEGPPRRRVDGRPTEGPQHAPSRAASAPRPPFDAAALGAARRQLLGLPLRLGSLCAMQRLDGVAVLRVCGWDSGEGGEGGAAGEGGAGGAGGEGGEGGEGGGLRRGDDPCRRARPCCIGHATVLHVLADDDEEDEEPSRCAALPSPPSRRPYEDEARCKAHGARVLSALTRHALALLGASLGAQRALASGDARLLAAGAGGGHALLCGPSGNGKRRLLRRLAARLQRRLPGTSLVRVRCASLLAAASSGRLAAALEAPFDEARRAVPSVLLLSELGLLAPAAPASSGAGADSEGGVHTQVAMALLRAMRSTPPGVLVMGSALDPHHLPSCLRFHGGFETLFEHTLPTAAQRAALLASWLPGTALPIRHSANPNGSPTAHSQRGEEDAPNMEVPTMEVPTTKARAEATATGRVPLADELRADAPIALDAPTDELRADAPLRAAAHAALLNELTAGRSLREVRRLLGAVAVRASARGCVPTWGDVIAILQVLVPTEAPTPMISGVQGLGGLGGESTSPWARMGGYSAVRARLQRLLTTMMTSDCF